MDDERKCRNCRFWVQQDAEDISGQCRRFPPSLPQTAPQQQAMQATGAGTFVGIWPDTLGLDWCGEFQTRKQLNVAQPLSVLNLSKPTLNLLERAGLRTVGDLTSRTAAQLWTIPRFGAARMQEVQERLTAHRLSLKESE